MRRKEPPGQRFITQISRLSQLVRLINRKRPPRIWTCIEAVVVFFILICPRGLYAQKERVAIHWDKLVSSPGDTVWFSATINADSVVPSTGLDVTLYSDSGKEIRHTNFRVLEDGFCYGQFKSPGKPGSYWLRIFSGGSMHEWFSLTVFGAGGSYSARHFGEDSATGHLLDEDLWLGRDSGGYFIFKRNRFLPYYSVAVTDTSLPMEMNTPYYQPSDRYSIDTSFLTYKFAVLPLSRHLPPARDFIFIVQSDTSSSGIRTGQLNKNGEAEISGLTFFDTAYFFYQISGENVDQSLELLAEPLPPFKRPVGYFTDTFRNNPLWQTGYRGAKILDTARVSLNYQLRNIRLHNFYVKGNTRLEGGYSHYNYDLRVDVPPASVQTLGQYVAWMRPRLHGQLIWFLDGKEQMGRMIWDYDIHRIRYIEFREGIYEGMTEAVYGLLYTKTGREALDIPGGMKHIAIKGYERRLPWSTPDRITTHFNAKVTSLKYYLPGKPPFRLSVMAFKDGHIYYDETNVYGN